MEVAATDGSGTRGTYAVVSFAHFAGKRCVRGIADSGVADGKSYTQIEREFNTSRPTIARWKTRFEKSGMSGLEAQHKGSKPRTVTPAVQARVLRKTTQPPADGSTHWSCRKLATTLGLGKSTVQRIWSQARVKPHQLERYMASDDPKFEEKAADILALYMDPPQHAASSASTKKLRFRHWTASIRCCHFRWAGRKNTGSSIIATEHSRFTLRWT